MTDAEHRSRILQEVAGSLVDRFGGDMYIRIGPSIQTRRRSLILEVFAPNTSSAPASLEIDETQAYLVIGDAVDCVLFEKHLLDDDVSRF